MTNETMKALLVIAAYGLFEITILFPTTRDLGRRMLGAVTVPWPTVAPPYALWPIAVGRKSAKR